MVQNSRVVLVVDAAAEDRELYRRCLLHSQNCSYTFLEASSGKEGLTLWRRQPDVVLLDDRLPDMDGLEFIASLSTSAQLACPIIMVTRVGTEAIAVQAIKAGAQDYLVKDQITPEQLQLTVNAAIATCQQQQRIAQDHLALQESEERFRQLAENVEMAFWITELPERRVSYVSPAYERLWGLSAQDIYNDYKAWIDLLHPDDRVRVDQAFQDRAIEGKFDEEYRIFLPDGGLRWIRDRCFPVHDASGQVYRLTGIAEDITERKQTEDKLRWQAQILDQTHDSVITTDLDGCIISWNQGAERIFGYTAAEILGRSVASLYPPGMDDFLETQVIAPLKANGKHEVEVVNQRKSGERITILLSLSLLRDHNDNPIGMIGYSLDITEREQAKVALANNEARLQGFVDSNVVGILYGDVYGNVHKANDELLRIVGYTQEDIATGRLRWIDITPPEYLPLDKEKIAEAQACGACTPYEKEYIRKDGGRVPVLIGYSLLGEALEESVAFILDLTKRKRAERALRRGKDRLRMAIESADLGTWDWNLTTNRLTWDAGCKAMFGLLPDAKVSIETFFEGLHPDDRDRTEQTMQRALDPDSGGDFKIEYRTIGIQDGTERWLQARGQAYFDTDNKPRRFVGTIMNITSRKQAEAERERSLQREQAAREEAERASRIKDEFLAILSHELRTPLNPILGWSKLLQTRKLSEDKTAQALETIERNAKLQTQLIDDLLDVARILRGKLKLDNTSVSLPSTIEAAIDTVRTAAEAKTIAMHIDLPDIGQVWGDAGHLQQIVWNLLSNAIKFTPRGGRVDIRLERIDNQAQITVIDTGKGISPDFLPHIFKSFRQEDASITRQHGGLGLGLAIVHHLVEAHGGTITADSPGEGQGATFMVRFPLLNYAPENNQTSPSLQDEITLTGIRVLAVDDSPDACALLTTLLTQYQAEVMVVTRAADVLANLDVFQPDVLVCDIGMPDMDGYGLMEHVRARSPEHGGQIPAIALTAYARPADQQQAIACGYQQHLAKPIDVDRLLDVIAKLTRHLRL